MTVSLPRTRRGRVLIATSVMALTLSGCSVGLQDMPVGGVGNTFDVRADLSTADGVVAGADVRNGQQVVGRVTDIALADGVAQLTIALDNGTELPANVKAAVEIPSALGTPFIRLEAPENPTGKLTAGAVIEKDDTTIGPQVEGTLAALGEVVNGSGLGQLQSVMQSLNTAFASRPEKVGELIDTLNNLLNHSSEYTADFNRAIAVSADVSEAFANQQDQIAKFLEETPKAVTVLAQQRDRIASLMQQTTGLAQNLAQITDGRQQLLNDLVPDAQKLVNSLAVFNDDVGETLTNMTEFMKNFSSAVKGDYLVFDGALDIPGGIDKILTGGMLLAGEPLPSPKDLLDVLSGGLTENEPKDKKKKSTKTTTKKPAASSTAEKSAAEKPAAEKNDDEKNDDEKKQGGQ